MANVDRPNGFTPIKTLSGAPWTSMVRSTGPADGEDIFVGDIVNLESGLADPAATNDSSLLGVVVGVGKVNDMSQEKVGMFNPDNLMLRYYDDSASTHTDYIIHYVPVDDVVFEAQTATALTLVPGDTCDLSDAAGDATSGISRQEITTDSNSDFTVVEVPNLVDNDNTLVWGRYWVMVTRAEQAFHG